MLLRSLATSRNIRCSPPNDESCSIDTIIQIHTHTQTRSTYTQSYNIQTHPFSQWNNILHSKNKPSGRINCLSIQFNNNVGVHMPVNFSNIAEKSSANDHETRRHSKLTYAISLGGETWRNKKKDWRCPIEKKTKKTTYFASMDAKENIDSSMCLR